VDDAVDKCGLAKLKDAEALERDAIEVRKVRSKSLVSDAISLRTVCRKVKLLLHHIDVA
jgi:hypothetical protein